MQTALYGKIKEREEGGEWLKYNKIYLTFQS